MLSLIARPNTILFITGEKGGFTQIGCSSHMSVSFYKTNNLNLTWCSHSPKHTPSLWFLFIAWDTYQLTREAVTSPNRSIPLAPVSPQARNAY